MEQISKNILIVSLLYIIFSLSITQDNELRIPFGLYNTKAKTMDLDLANNIFYNFLYINLSIGTPPQKILCELIMNSQTFTINNETFNKNNSSTYEELSKYENTDDKNEIASGYNSMDILNINSRNQKINFILSNKFKYINYPFGIIGLSIPNNIENNVYPFFNSLKLAQLINSFTWTLKYYDNLSLLDTINGNENNNKIIGELVIGNDPHNYEKETFKYNKSQLIKINPISSYEYSWDIQFDKIFLLYHGNENMNKSVINIQLNGRTKLMPGVGFIFMPKEFNYIINKRFFEKYFNKTICRSKFINDSFYSYIECDNISSFEISTFPDICFEHKTFETIFNFTYKDLFVYNENENKYIFLMTTDKYLSGWIFGSIFLKKYQLIFNQDSKTIGYYKPMDYDSETENNNKENKNDSIIKYVLIGIIIIITSILLISIGILIQKYLSKKEKIKANELEDEILFI